MEVWEKIFLRKERENSLTSIRLKSKMEIKEHKKKVMEQSLQVKPKS